MSRMGGTRNHNKRVMNNDNGTSGDKILSLLALESLCDTDKEIIVVLSTWLDNWDDDMCISKKEMLINLFMPSPTMAILDYMENPCFEKSQKYMSFFRTLTFANLHNLILKIRDCLITSGSILGCCAKKRQIKGRKKYKYGHDLLASIFAGETGFQSSLANCTFYRYNKIIYLLTYKYSIWDKKIIGKSIIPCNDHVFQNAFKHGITKKRMKVTLQNAIWLTNVARKKYGEEIYKLYEELI
ncbi:MAG: hypothetical protein J6S67_09260 [Methanobrevibacter sp.]|nr:hypothetical protein [Methanobrevibacter sp.]